MDWKCDIKMEITQGRLGEGATSDLRLRPQISLGATGSRACYINNEDLHAIFLYFTPPPLPNPPSLNSGSITAQ